MTSSWWAPAASRPLDATVTVPGSKSLTNRHLLLSALADGDTHLVAPLHSRDSALMIDALRALGVGVGHEGQAEGDGTDLVVRPPRTGLRGGGHVDCGLAGTVMRFVPPLAALADGPVTFDGDPRARERPMAPIVDALRGLGIAVDDEGRGTLPFTVHGTGAVAGGSLSVDSSASSQFVSALLLLGPHLRDGLDLTLSGPNLPSRPHVAMTVAVLRERGVTVETPAPDAWQVLPGPVSGGRLVIEPDLSNAGPFVAAALVAGGTVRIPHWPSVTLQPGDLLRPILQSMGATVDLADGVLTVSGTGTIRGIDLDLSPAGELTPTIAALAALAETPSRLTGIGHLRGHETDRLAALVTEITRLGGQAHELPDGIAITPAPLHGATVRAYDDHRMATFGAIVGLAVPGVGVDDIATTAKTLPDFPGLWSAMLSPTPSPAAAGR